MKKFATITLAIMVAACISAIAFAGEVYDRTGNITVTSGSGAWTNTLNYAALKLLRVYVYTNTAASGTVTVTRAASGYTGQAVASVTCSSSNGTSASFTQTYMKPGDILNLAEGASSNCVVVIEYAVQKH